jgi:hypothetical protein
MCFDNIVDIFVNIEKLIEKFPYYPLSFSPSFLAIYHFFPLSSSFFIVVLVIPCHPLPSFIACPIVPHHPPITPNVAHCMPLKGINISIWHMIEKKKVEKKKNTIPWCILCKDLTPNKCLHCLMLKPSN